MRSASPWTIRSEPDVAFLHGLGERRGARERR